MKSGTIKSGCIVENITIPLTTLSWVGDGTNKYYAQTSDFSPSGKDVIASSISNWNALKPNDVVQIYVSSGNGKLTVMSNTKSFSTGASITARVAYRIRGGN